MTVSSVPRTEVRPRQESKAIDVSVILVSYNTEALLPLTLKALRQASTGLGVQVLIVDNASRDRSAMLIQRDFPECELIVNPVNVGFGRACNQALARARGRYVLLLNTDAFVATDTLEKTLRYMEAHPRCGILGVKLVDQDGRLQPSARRFMTPWSLFLKRTGLHRLSPRLAVADEVDGRQAASIRQCDWVPGCYYLVRRQVIDQVGLFDPRYFLYFEEVDHCLAANRADWDVTYYPHATVRHIGGESARAEGEVTPHSQLDALQVESELLYFRKNHGLPAVVFNLLLMSIADGIDLLRCVGGRKPPGTAEGVRRHLQLEWSLFWRTRCGARPTR